MEKKSTPIQEAIKYMKEHRGHTTLYRGMIEEMLESLLLKEKQFAEESFRAGFEFCENIPLNSGIMPEKNPNLISFKDYYKQYENE